MLWRDIHASLRRDKGSGPLKMFVVYMDCVGVVCVGPFCHVIMVMLNRLAMLRNVSEPA